MSDEPVSQLPAELRAFVHTCLESIEQVELLMLLRGSAQARTAREVAAALRLTPAIARRDLETLAARGLLEVRVGEETAYRYRPKLEELGRYCDLLAQHYVTSRQTLLGFVATESRRSLKRFADAFKLRKPEK
jgi:DNA-binding IclR family transcriptional regulator